MKYRPITGRYFFANTKLTTILTLHLLQLWIEPRILDTEGSLAYI